MTPNHDSDKLNRPNEDDAWVDRLAERLERERGVPSAAFRSRLRRHIIEMGAQSSTRRWGRPAYLRFQVAAYLCSALLLLGVAALGLTGSGPLGY